jgi:putative ABC transport system ATP-binding protein
MTPIDNKAVLSAQDLAKQVVFNGAPLDILQSASLSVQPGKAWPLSGLPVLANPPCCPCWPGWTSQRVGEVALFGQSLAGLSEDGRALLRRDKVGFVFQNFQLDAATDCAGKRHAAAGAGRAQGCPRYRQPDAGPCRPGASLRHYPRHLSGGEQQRVALARAFAIHPGILFADEPTGNLDAATGRQIIDLLFQLNSEQHTSLVLVTHDNELASRCDAIYRLVDGRLNGARS